MAGILKTIKEYGDKLFGNVNISTWQSDKVQYNDLEIGIQEVNNIKQNTKHFDNFKVKTFKVKTDKGSVTIDCYIKKE